VSADQLAPVLALAGTALALPALILVLIVVRWVRQLQRDQRVVLGSRGEIDIVTHVANLDQKLDHLRSATEDLALTARDHEVRIDGCLSRVGMVRFDAVEDLGGRQSTSLVMLDAKEDGMVITTVVSRDFARIYVKTIKDGRSDIPLAPEEIEALDQARTRGNLPFTIRPRLEELRKDQEGEQPDLQGPAAADSDGVSEAAARALERENRRRRRQGLPPLDELPPAPSTLGWPKLEPACEESPEVTFGDDALPVSGDGAAGPGRAEADLR